MELPMDMAYLPQQFWRFFWDVDAVGLTERHLPFIAERLLVFGDTEAVRWLLAAMPREEFRGLVRSSRRLDPKTRAFWRAVLGEAEAGA